jgi:hypothetical protein
MNARLIVLYTSNRAVSWVAGEGLWNNPTSILSPTVALGAIRYEPLKVL